MEPLYTKSSWRVIETREGRLSSQFFYKGVNPRTEVNISGWHHSAFHPTLEDAVAHIEKKLGDSCPF